MDEMAKWFERKFPWHAPVEIFPMFLERLRGAPVRVEEKASTVAPGFLTVRDGEDWSIQEHVGHLLDLEPLWSGRLDDFDSGLETLRPADLTNTKTREANHNDAALDTLVTGFRREREAIVARLDAMTIKEAGRAALHPRLELPMRVIDLCQFVAEHDDHHLALITRVVHRLSR